MMTTMMMMTDDYDDDDYDYKFDIEVNLADGGFRLFRVNIVRGL